MSNANAETEASTVVLVCSLLPVTLLVSSSVLLDRALRHETVWNRSRAQCTAWLALAVLSLSTAMPETETESKTTLVVVLAWGHLTLCFNLLAVLVPSSEANGTRTQTQTQTPLRTQTQTQTGIGHCLRSVVPVLPLSSGLAMLMGAGFALALSTSTSTSTSISTSPPTTTTDDYYSRLVTVPWWWSVRTFFASVVGLWFVRWHLRRTRKTQTQTQTQTRVGLPVVGSVSAASSCSSPDAGDRCGGIVARLCGMPRVTAAALHTTGSTVVSTSTNAGSDSSWLDERRWHAWNRVQAMQWFAQQLSSPTPPSASNRGGNRFDNNNNNNNDNEDNNNNNNNNNNDEFNEANERILRCLVSHRITGDVLDGLVDASQWVALGVPFGPAYRLADATARLIDRYPPPGSSRTVLGSRARTIGNERYPLSNDCLDLHDDLYNNPHRARRVKDIREFVAAEVTPQQLQHPAAPYLPVDPNHHHQQQHHNEQQQQQQQKQQQHHHHHHHKQQHPQDPLLQGGISEEQHEKLNNVMKERFGLELPKLRAADFLAVHKGLSQQAKNNGETQSHPLAPTGSPQQSHPLATATTGATAASPMPLPRQLPLPRQPYQDAPPPPPPPPPLQAPFDHGTNPVPSFSPERSGIPGSIVGAMPPQIREIAKRRPDLLETIWKNKQIHPLQQFPRGQPQSFSLPVAIAEERRGETTGNNNNDENENENEASDDEDETTSLIQRDADEFPLRYRAIGKTRMEGIV